VSQAHRSRALGRAVSEITTGAPFVAREPPPVQPAAGGRFPVSARTA
jgi:hypothetical protein